jgi:hypothetical protein
MRASVDENEAVDAELVRLFGLSLHRPFARLVDLDSIPPPICESPIKTSLKRLAPSGGDTGSSSTVRIVVVLIFAAGSGNCVVSIAASVAVAFPGVLLLARLSIGRAC